MKQLIKTIVISYCNRQGIWNETNKPFDHVVLFSFFVYFFQSVAISSGALNSLEAMPAKLHWCATAEFLFNGKRVPHDFARPFDHKKLPSSCLFGDVCQILLHFYFLSPIFELIKGRNGLVAYYKSWSSIRTNIFSRSFFLLLNDDEKSVFFGNSVVCCNSEIRMTRSSPSQCLNPHYTVNKFCQVVGRCYWSDLQGRFHGVFPKGNQF